MDGANVEIAEEIEENMFIFGHRADVVPGLRRERECFNVPEDFYKIVIRFAAGSSGGRTLQPRVRRGVRRRDYYLLANDFDRTSTSAASTRRTRIRRGGTRCPSRPRVPESLAATAPSGVRGGHLGRQTLQAADVQVECSGEETLRQRGRCELRRAREWTDGTSSEAIEKKYSCFTATHRRTEPAPTNPARPTTRSKDTYPRHDTSADLSPPSPRRTSRDRVGVPSREPLLERHRRCLRPTSGRSSPRSASRPRRPARSAARRSPRASALATARASSTSVASSASPACVRRSTRKLLRGRSRRPGAREHLRRRRRVSIVNLGASRHEHGRDKLALARLPTRLSRRLPPDLRVAASPSAVPRDIARADAHPPRRRVRQNHRRTHVNASSCRKTRDRPVGPGSSIARAMARGAGEERTPREHPPIASQATLHRGRDVESSAVIGRGGVAHGGSRGVSRHTIVHGDVGGDGSLRSGAGRAAFPAPARNASSAASGGGTAEGGISVVERARDGGDHFVVRFAYQGARPHP